MTTTEVPAADQAAVAALPNRLSAARVHQDAASSAALSTEDGTPVRRGRSERRPRPVSGTTSAA
ncbi:hypothetical protein [Amycolatopsis sp. lyj-23]|uniref:hypothetical protein n=1 Tax=Amycolatopsis sp. lyj-23 TaxID=2789283 RepID=UPI00397C7000